MQYLHKKSEPIEMQHAQNVAQEDHEPADRLVRGKLGRERVKLESGISELLNHNKPSPEPGQNQ